MTWEEYKKKNKVKQNNVSNVQNQRQIAPINTNNENNKTTSSWEEYKKKNNVKPNRLSTEYKEEDSNVSNSQNQIVPVAQPTSQVTYEEKKKKIMETMKIGETEAEKILADMEKTQPMKKVDSSTMGGKEITFDDGFFKSSNANVTQKILGTVADAGLNVGKGIANIGENVGDLASYGVAGVADLIGQDEYADKVRQNAQRNLVDEFMQPAQKELNNYSVLGNKSKEVAQGLGYVAGNTAISMFAGGVAPLSAKAKASTIASMATTFASSMGGGMTEAYQEGADDEEAFTYGLVSGLGETGSELLFGGLGKGTKALGLSKGIGGLDDQIAVGLTKGVKNQMAKILIQAGIKSAGEGAEEVISGYVSAVAKKVTYMKDEDFGELIKNQNLWDQFCMGALTSAIAEAPSVGVSIKNGTDYVTLDYNDNKNKSNLTQNENNIGKQQTILNNNKTAQNQNTTQLGDIMNNKEIPMQNYQYEKSDNILVDTLRKDASKYFNNSEKAHNYINMLEQIVTDKGIGIRLDSNLKTSDGKIANGAYANGVITINLNSTRAGEFIAIHELTHAIGTEQMRNIVEKYRTSNIELDTELQNILQNYNTTELTDEAMADVAGQLFGNQEFINNIKQNNPNIFQKIYSEIKYLWHQFRGYKTQDQFVNDLYYKWTKAYNSNNKLNNNSDYSIQTDNSGNKYVKVDTDQYIFDGINKKDYNKIAKMYIEDYLLGNTNLSNTDTANIDKRSAKKYTNPGKVQNKFYEKMKLTPELKNALEISEKVSQKGPIKVNSKYNNWEYYKFRFELEGKKFEGLINIGIDSKGNKHFYEINNIKEASILGTSLDNRTDFYKNSIAPINKDVNTTNKYSIQESENNSGSFDIQDNKSWQDYLEKNFKATGTRTNLEDIRLQKREIAPKAEIAKENIKTLNTESKKEQFDRYKKNIINANEKTINDLISYKNESIRSIEQKIEAKQSLLNSKKNKDTKAVATIRSQIENLKAQKIKVESLYNEKIDKFNGKISKEKIELEVRNTMKTEARNSLKAEIEPLIQDLTKYKDKKAGILFNRETAQRNIDDIVKDKELATAIKETVFDPVQEHQAEKNREINRLAEKINSLDLDKKKKYYYVPEGEIAGIKVDEATLAQLIIEKKINDTDLRNYGIDDVGIKKINNTANTFTEILDYLYNRMNEEQIKYGYSPIGKIENYFPHFFESKSDKMLGKIASYFGIDLSKQELPTEIAGKTETFKPGEVWNSNLKKRRTNKTDYDALTAMQEYINGACEIIYTTEDIQRVREYSKQIRYKFSDEGIKTEIDKIINNTELTQEAKDLSLEGIFGNTKNELSNFVTWLDDYANTLAGKKAFSDRSIEHNIGRNVYSSMAGIESRIAANTIGGNLSVSLTNFAPIFQAAGTTKWNYLITGMLQTAQNDVSGFITKNKDVSFVSNSDFLTNRFGTDTITKKKVTQKASDILSIPMNAIDEFVAESIVRAKYLENIDKGMNEEVALNNADKYAAKIMADRSKGALPLIFNAKNPLAKLVTMFQVEPNNIVSNYLKDMPRDAKSKKQLTWQATKLMVASYAFNTVMMGIRGGGEVLPDPIRWVSYLIQAITGDDDEKEKAKKDLTESILGSTPFASNIAGLFGAEDIGRIPISNAMPNISNLVKLKDKDVDSEYKKEIALKELSKPLLYLGLPVGGAQLNKTVQGIATVIAGGSYKTNSKGEKQLQFPIENKNIGTYLKAIAFGKNSLPDAKAYADRGYKPLTAKQTEGYEKVQIPYREFLDYIDNTKQKKKEEKIEYINNMGLNENKQWNMHTYDIFSSTEREKDGGSQLTDAEYAIKNGVTKKEYIEIYNKASEKNVDMPTETEYKELKEQGISLNTYIDYKIKVKDFSNNSDEKIKTKDKLDILINSKYSSKEKAGIYKEHILTNDKAKEKFELMEKTGITNSKYINEYLKYKQQDFESDVEDNGTTKGKTVSGSAKKKVYEYVNNMDITYEQRLLLLGTQYKLTDAERTKVYNYVKSLDYTQDEMQKVFESLKGFTVYKDGRVTW